LKSFKSDNGSEFKTLSNYFKRHGIIHEKSPAYEAQSNGKIERNIKTIKNAARTMLQQSGVDESLWAEAVACAVYIHNRILNSTNKEKTAYEQIFNRKPSIGHFRIFGSTAYVLIPDAKRSTWMAKGRKMILIGYDGTRSYRLIDEETKEIIISSNATFKVCSCSVGLFQVPDGRKPSKNYQIILRNNSRK
jgi:hypothetical protein